MFDNRLRKNLRRLAPWAARRHVSAYRLYDRDIPELGLAIDRYPSGLHVSVYARNADRDEHDPYDDGPDDDDLRPLLDLLAERCQVAPSSIHVKRRFRQRGAAQYERVDHSGHETLCPEGPCRLRVNLRDYVDTGLFLDHRDARRFVARLARGQRVLNLFCYTGAFTVHAGVGGARSTTSVDLSRTYLEWAGRNLEGNALRGRAHRLVQGDARLFLRDEPDTYELIVLDPPTFSNSKRMDGVLDIQRDHPDLLRSALRRLSPDGVLLFSSNFRRLVLEPAAVPEARLTEVSEHTVPFDFHDRRVHRAFLVQHRHASTPAAELCHLLYSETRHA